VCNMCMLVRTVCLHACVCACLCELCGSLLMYVHAGVCACMCELCLCAHALVNCVCGCMCLCMLFVNCVCTCLCVCMHTCVGEKLIPLIFTVKKSFADVSRYQTIHKSSCFGCAAPMDTRQGPNPSWNPFHIRLCCGSDCDKIHSSCWYYSW
jgi:hypothetical protein